MHAPGAAHCRALCRNVARRRDAGADQPLRQGRVEAAGHGVLGDSVVAGEKGAHLELRVARCGLRRDDADFPAAQQRAVGLQGQHLLGRAQHHAAPRWSVLAPGVRHDVVARYAQAARDALHIIFGERAAPSQRGRREGQVRAITPDAHQPDTALLHDVLALGPAAGGQPRMTTAQGRVPRERQLAAGAEDAQCVVGLHVRRRRHEGRFRQIRPVGEALHRCGVDAAAVEHHGHRIAFQRRVGEDIDLCKAPFHFSSASFSTRASAATPCSILSGGTVTNDRRSVFRRGAPA